MSRTRTWSSITATACLAGLIATAMTSLPATAQKITSTKGAREAGRPDDPKAPRRAKPEGEEAPEPLSPAMKAVVEAHPEHELVLCMAGCGSGQPRILWQRTRIQPGETDTIPGVLKASDAVAAEAPVNPEIICVAGCNGPSGSVLWRGVSAAGLGERPAIAMMHGILETTQTGALLSASERSWMQPDARSHLSAAMTAMSAHTSTAATRE